LVLLRNNPLAVIWTAFGIFWLLPAILGKRTVQRQASGPRILQLALLVAAYVLLADSDLGLDFLDRPLVPEGRGAVLIGYSLLAAGLLFAGWARLTLGGNWSSNVTIKQDHTLVSSGPYRIVRHPIYTGLLVALLGTAIVLRELRCFLGVVLAAIAWKYKSINEEVFMVQKFGDQYARYRMEVKGLVPYIW
jgi:protein-S-isoprenylcysteine O-methyltransferase Ste14